MPTFPVLERFAYLNAGTFGPLAREVAGQAEVRSALPKAHHFGHR